MPSSMKPLVIVTRKLPDAVEVRMKELFNTRLNEADKPLSRAVTGEVHYVDAGFHTIGVPPPDRTNGDGAGK